MNWSIFRMRCHVCNLLLNSSGKKSINWQSKYWPNVKNCWVCVVIIWLIILISFHVFWKGFGIKKVGDEKKHDLVLTSPWKQSPQEKSTRNTWKEITVKWVSTHVAATPDRLLSVLPSYLKHDSEPSGWLKPEARPPEGKLHRLTATTMLAILGFVSWHQRTKCLFFFLFFSWKKLLLSKRLFFMTRGKHTELIRNMQAKRATQAIDPNTKLVPQAWYLAHVKTPFWCQPW